MLIFRRTDLSGWAKAAWVAFVIFVPLLGVLAYLVARGGHLANDQIMESQGRHGADELTKLAGLRDRGVITDEEFRKGKVQLLG